MDEDKSIPGGKDGESKKPRVKKATSEKKKTPDEMAAAMPYEAATARLEEIVKNLEGGALSLEESLSLYEEGVALVRRCSRELSEAEQRVKVLRRSAEGDIQPVDFKEPTGDT